MPSPTILFADDDDLSRELVRTMLQQAGMIPVLAADGNEAIKAWSKTAVDLVILDVMMPYRDGFETCRYLRRTSDVPIMMLTSRNSEQDLLKGFEAGADDYIVKPFRPKELLARISAILQRATRLAETGVKHLTYADLHMNVSGQQVTRNDKPLPISQLEFQLLQYLMQHTGVVVSKDDLMRDVWGYTMSSGGLNLVEVAIRRLREKIEQDPAKPVYIKTIRGSGYRFGS
jgi:DNA-binding response OmpR family regulator